MDSEQLKAFLKAQPETDTVEFKKTTAELSAAGKILCAFLNAAGGLVFIGVKDNGDIVACL